MKFDRSNKFELCYYGQVNSLRLKSSVVSKWASGGSIYFSGDYTYLTPIIVFLKLHKKVYILLGHLQNII